MVQSIHAVLRNALGSAVREEVIPRNVAGLVKVATPKYTVNRGPSVAPGAPSPTGREVPPSAKVVPDTTANQLQGWPQLSLGS
jgi:hypothetical protein